MTRIEMIRDTLRRIAEETTDEQIARLLLVLCHEEILDPEDMYPRWCDDQGACKGRDCEALGDCCSDEEHVACIVRYLRGECQPDAYL